MKTVDKVLNALYNCLDIVFSILYPNRCVGCKEIVDNDLYLCTDCERKIERFDSKKRCKICGLDKENCDCKKYVYYFDGAVCVYKNTDIARNTVYSYKLGRRLANVSFLAQEMANSVKKELRNIQFDAVIGVPTTFKSRIKYGFSPVDELCFAMEELLEVNFLRGILKCRRFNRTQHHLDFSRRFENAGKKFYCDGKIDAKTILLVDDIKTSGATLSHCARQLKFAGAERVYCITALASVTKNKNHSFK